MASQRSVGGGRSTAPCPQWAAVKKNMTLPVEELTVASLLKEVAALRESVEMGRKRQRDTLEDFSETLARLGDFLDRKPYKAMGFLEEKAAEVDGLLAASRHPTSDSQTPELGQKLSH